MFDSHGDNQGQSQDDARQQPQIDIPWLTDDALRWTLLNGAAAAANGGYDAGHTPSIPTHLLVAPTTESSSSSSPFSFIQSAEGSAANGGPAEPSPGVAATNKRPWTSTNDGPPVWKLAGLADCVAHDHPLRGVREWSCSTANCFQMSPLPSSPSDYRKQPLRFDRFAARILDPSQPAAASSETMADDGAITRPTGRALRLVITAMPRVHAAQARAMDDGFALIIVCRRDAQQTCHPLCLASFDGQSRSRGRGGRERDVGFAANLEHCVDEASGRRIWGQRSSHVRRPKGQAEPLKAVRLQPKGALGAGEEESICFYIALFDPTGGVLRHDDGSPCIACANVVRYVPRSGAAKQPDDDDTAAADDDLAALDATDLLRQLEKLTILERAEVASMAGIDGTARLTYISTDPRVQERLGIKIFDSRSLPSTAVALSAYQRLDTPEQIEFPTVSDDMAVRTRAAARKLGWYHADPTMTEPRVRECAQFAKVLYQFDTADQLIYEREAAWLAQLDLDIDIAATKRRARAIGELLLRDRFRSTRTICSLNPYPDRILVDRVDPGMVYCLADTVSESEVMLGERIWALARLAFCVKAPREWLHELIVVPYVEGFCSRGEIEVIPSTKAEGGHFVSPYARQPINGPVVDEEKFYLLLHAMHLLFFRYWICFRSPPAVRRIHRRLLEEDAMFDESYYTQDGGGGFTKFHVRQR